MKYPTMCENNALFQNTTELKFHFELFVDVIIVYMCKIYKTSARKYYFKIQIISKREIRKLPQHVVQYIVIRINYHVLYQKTSLKHVSIRKSPKNEPVVIVFMKKCDSFHL